MTKLIPFDLERAKKGDALITRNGIDVIEFHYFEKANINPIVCLLYRLINSLDEGFSCYTEEGKNTEDHAYDLFMKPKIKNYYLNIYHDKEDGTFFTGYVTKTKEECEKSVRGSPHFLKTISFEVEE